MKITRIFVRNKQALFAVHTDGEEFDEFVKLFNQWKDPVFLMNFFMKHKNNFKKPFVNKINDACLNVRKNANLISQKIRDAERDKVFLESLFQPLNDLESAYKIPQRSKHKIGNPKKDIPLRIYAIKADKNIYVITGGAIKLTNKMYEAEHTAEELKKLNKCKNFLKENELNCIENFTEFGI